MKRSNQIKSHRAHLRKMLRRHRITVDRAHDIVWTSRRIDELRGDIDLGLDEWTKDDWPHA